MNLYRVRILIKSLLKLGSDQGGSLSGSGLLIHWWHSLGEYLYCLVGVRKGCCLNMSLPEH